MQLRAKIQLERLLLPGGKATFLRRLPPQAKVLDVGCANNSPAYFKTVRPDLHYIGLDICEHAQTSEPSLRADQMIVATPSEFVSAIENLRGQLDAIVSSHNIEHCEDPDRILEFMLDALKPDGCLYLAFPSEASVRFPRRKGTLNFFDDPTHTSAPVWSEIISRITARGLKIQFAAKRYRPKAVAFLGLVLEPASALLRRVMPARSTWALYGFESIVWAKKVAR